MWAKKLSQKDNAAENGEESETKTEGGSAEPAEPVKLKPKNSLKALMTKVVPKGEDGALRWKTLKDMAQEGEAEAAKNRVLYARKAGEEFGQHVDDGEKISQETACSLKHFAWGSANMPPKSEWLKQGIPLHPAEGLFAYGVRAPRNGTRNFLICLNAYFLKHLLFDTGKKKNTTSKRYRRVKEEHTTRMVGYWGQVLKPSEKVQTEMFCGGLAEILFRVADGNEAVFCLPGSDNCFEPSAHYGIDGVTEKLRLFTIKKEEDLKTLIKRYVTNLWADNGTGLLSILYSIMLSRSFDRLKKDMQDQHNNSLIDPMGECTQCLLNLVVIGRATPYLHNGDMQVELEETGEQSGNLPEHIYYGYDHNSTESQQHLSNEDHQNKSQNNNRVTGPKFVERAGAIGRNDIGFLLWEKDQLRTEKWGLGSRMKTPTLPMWVTKVNGQIGVLFNPNKELMRSYNAENRFQLYYYSDAEFKKEERKDTVLTIDTRTKIDKHITQKDEMDDGDLDDDMQEAPLQLAIKTKWEGADIDWHGVHAYV